MPTDAPLLNRSYGPKDTIVNIQAGGLQLKHPACGFETELRWNLIRKLGQVVCKCGMTLVDCKTLVCQLDESIIQLQRDTSYTTKARQLGVAALECTRRHLLYD